MITLRVQYVNRYSVKNTNDDSVKAKSIVSKTNRSSETIIHPLNREYTHMHICLCTVHFEHEKCDISISEEC